MLDLLYLLIFILATNGASRAALSLKSTDEGLFHATILPTRTEWLRTFPMAASTVDDLNSTLSVEFWLQCRAEELRSYFSISALPSRRNHPRYPLYYVTVNGSRDHITYFNAEGSFEGSGVFSADLKNFFLGGHGTGIDTRRSRLVSRDSIVSVGFSDWEGSFDFPLRLCYKSEVTS